MAVAARAILRSVAEPNLRLSPNLAESEFRKFQPVAPPPFPKYPQSSSVFLL